MKGLKTGGREQGTPNKLTSDLRERISDFLNDNWELIEIDFKALQPDKRIMIFEKLLQYSLPRLQTTQLTIPERKMDDNELNDEINRLCDLKTPLTVEERKTKIERLKSKLFENEPQVKIVFRDFSNKDT